ncbi:putative vacuolar atp synthase subunit c protein [Botrytis fragariae]|uniref:V-type proton ATPase subunit C n=1 Tax=Botrytis fragariae TaxID=1964551 RepID=A0A8H6ED45_9HELO|nr:putative vacuolar atp synthase subunit c protein [Botrytis fragariae]KAF5867738.1 putative vacuolar atp synthase subunit c protein [Botrytis fragariae]
MSVPTKYILVSLPTSISQSSDKEEALTALRSTISPDNGTTIPFKIPEFKIGTLDALVGQADDLAKLESACQGVVAKVGESLRNLLEGDESKIAQQKTVNDKPADQYLRTFSWNKVKYRADKPLAELIDSLQKELVSIDNDVKGKMNQYNQVKTNLTTLQRKQTGNLSTKSLTPVVDPKLLVQDSEYLETHLVVVPTNVKKDFLKTYETISPMVVPRSSVEVTHDDEFTLFAVTTFKKHSADFQHKCRENKWTPRDYKYVEGGKEVERKEAEKVEKDERKVWGEALRLGRTGWSEAVMIWIHVLTLRVFVETVLRYGLPLDFVCGLVKSNPKGAKKAKAALDSTYGYLGGNAFGRDKKGKALKDDSALSSEIAAAGVGGGEGNEYTAYVYYEFEII